MPARSIGIIFYLFISCLFFFAGTGSARAESVRLGSFTPQMAGEKFYKNIALKIKDASFNLSTEQIQKFIREKEDLAYNPSYHSEIENNDLCAYEKSLVCGLLWSAKEADHIQKVSSIYLDTEFSSRFLDDLARQVNRDPQNARLQADDSGKISVFALSENGLTLDNAKNLRILEDYFKGNDNSRTIALAYNEIKPEITTDSIDNLGITSLIGEGVSDFAGSPKNRVFNIRVAANRFNGFLIKPGENFSFVKTLGPVDGEHGYLPELVIKGNKTEPDFGGGICQVSTTAFRAAIMSGLKITARTPHAYPVQYYNPQGMDATVFIPSPDLKFTNNTAAYVLIQTKIAGTQLFFNFYGIDDGRKINIIGPTITERNPDGSMKATFTQQVLDKSGNQIINDVFNSAYDSPNKYPHPGQVLTEKPKDWSQKQWRQYKKDNHL